jgi:hypothetical protein
MLSEGVAMPSPHVCDEEFHGEVKHHRSCALGCFVWKSMLEQLERNVAGTGSRNCTGHVGLCGTRKNGLNGGGSTTLECGRLHRSKTCIVKGRVVKWCEGGRKGKPRRRKGVRQKVNMAGIQQGNGGQT